MVRKEDGVSQAEKYLTHLQGLMYMVLYLVAEYHKSSELGSIASGQVRENKFSQITSPAAASSSSR